MTDLPAAPPAQTAPPAALPPFSLRGDVTVDLGNIARIDVTNVRLEWGALTLTADRLVGDTATDKDTGQRLLRNFVATGHVSLTRGGQRIVGERFVYDGVNGSFAADNATMVDPPLFVRGRTLSGTFFAPPTLEATDALVVPHESGRAEISATAARVRVENGVAHLQNATIRLFGTRVLTLPRVSFGVGTGGRASGQSLEIPVTFRTSRISGVTIGVDLPFTVAREVDAEAILERTSRRGFQYSARIGIELLPRSLRAQPALPAPPTVSPLRALVTAPPPPRRDIGNLGALRVPATVPALRRTGASVRLDVALDGNREFGAHRFADLLVTREPEVRLVASTPSTAWGRVTLGVGEGRFREQRVGRTTALGTVVRDRTQLSTGWISPSASIGSTGYARLAAQETQSRYDDGMHYGVFEWRATVGWSPAPRTGIELGIIDRKSRGATPFFFDQVDTASEGLLRTQTAVGRVTLGAALRFDVRQRSLFDAELVAAIRGRALETRLRYTVLTQQWGIGLGLSL